MIQSTNLKNKIVHYRMAIDNYQLSIITSHNANDKTGSIRLMTTMRRNRQYKT